MAFNTSIPLVGQEGVSKAGHITPSPPAKTGPLNRFLKSMSRTPALPAVPGRGSHEAFVNPVRPQEYTTFDDPQPKAVTLTSDIGF
jgi:hypothetical protein